MLECCPIFGWPTGVDPDTIKLVVLKLKFGSGSVEKFPENVLSLAVGWNRFAIVNLVVAIDLNVQMRPINVAYVLEHQNPVADGQPIVVLGGVIFFGGKTLGNNLSFQLPLVHVR